MDTIKVLKDAYALISNIEHWSQDGYAHDNAGCECRVDENFAYSFCAIGALCKVTGLEPEEIGVTQPHKMLRDAVLDLSGKPQIAAWNDGEDFEKAHKRVLRAYRLAIKKAKAS